MSDERFEVDGAASDQVEREPVHVRAVPATRTFNRHQRERGARQRFVSLHVTYRKLPLMVSSWVRTVCMSRLMSGRPIPICVQCTVSFRRGVHEYQKSPPDLNHRAAVLEEENRSSDADLGAEIGPKTSQHANATPW